MILTVLKYNNTRFNRPRAAISRLDGKDTLMEKAKGIREAKEGKGFTGYQPGDSYLKGTKSPGS